MFDFFKKNKITSEDAKSMVRAKVNELVDKGLVTEYSVESYYSEKVSDAYGVDDYVNTDQWILSEMLIASQTPKFVRLGRFLQEICNKYNKSYEKAKAVLKHEDKVISQTLPCLSLAKEFIQIDDNFYENNNYRRKQLKKFKDVSKFIKSGGVSRIVRAAKEQGLTEASSANDLTNFFYSNNELAFLNKSKLTKHL